VKKTEKPWRQLKTENIKQLKKQRRQITAVNV
jgi:hypothetical protein